MAQSQGQNKNIWDMIINDEISLADLTNQAPSYNAPQIVNYVPAAAIPSVRAPYPVYSSSNYGLGIDAGGTFSASSVLKPKVEILKLLESFIKLKAEIVTKLYAVAVDNWDSIVYLFNAFINNIGTLSAFTVNGIVILRNVLEVAARLFSSWQITVPNVNVDFSTLLRESNFYDV